MLYAVNGQRPWAFGFYKTTIRAQSHHAFGQAFLPVRKDQFMRLDALESSFPIEMDEARTARSEMPAMARVLVESAGHRVAALFLHAISPEVCKLYLHFGA